MATAPLPLDFYTAQLAINAQGQLTVRGPHAESKPTPIEQASKGKFQIRITLWDPAEPGDGEPPRPVETSKTNFKELKAYLGALNDAGLAFGVEITCVGGP